MALALYERGNLAAKTAWRLLSPQIRDPLVRDLIARTLADESNAYLRQVAYEMPLKMWAENVVMADLVLAKLAEHMPDVPVRL